MKIIAVLLMLLGVAMIVGYGFLYLLGFAMSFDAPGSTTDPKGWMMRIFIFLPLLGLLAILVFAIRAFLSGQYKKSALIGSVFAVTGLGAVAYTTITTSNAMNNYNDQMAREADDARLYPVQKFIRQGETGADTIIVFPNRIVAYRLNVNREYPHNGPLGDLNSTRDTLIYDRRPDTQLKMEELYHFMDEQGRVFTNVYAVR
jgi:hypothetical protein